MSETTNAAEESARIRAEFTVEGALAGMRLDAALAGALDAPRTRTSGWIRDGHVTVTNNGKAVKIGKSYSCPQGMRSLWMPRTARFGGHPPREGGRIPHRAPG